MTEQVDKGGAVLVDAGEFARFIATGVIATIGNLAVVWALRQTVGYEPALLCGIATGFAISFVLTKIFAFRSAEAIGATGELARFLVVYALGVGVNMAVAVLSGRIILPHWLALREAQMAGAFLGAGSMTFTSYFGHRFFTYRTGRTRPE